MWYYCSWLVFGFLGGILYVLLHVIWPKTLEFRDVTEPCVICFDIKYWELEFPVDCGYWFVFLVPSILFFGMWQDIVWALFRMGVLLVQMGAKILWEGYDVDVVNFIIIKLKIFVILIKGREWYRNGNEDILTNIHNQPEIPILNIWCQNKLHMVRWHL